MAYDMRGLREIVEQGLELSPEHEVLVEQSRPRAGRSIEMEVMRDQTGNGIIICSIENLDPMGVHTGDSITVAPAQTLSDVEIPAPARLLPAPSWSAWAWPPAAPTCSSP